MKQFREDLIEAKRHHLNGNHQQMAIPNAEIYPEHRHIHEVLISQFATALSQNELTPHQTNIQSYVKMPCPLIFALVTQLLKKDKY